MKSIIVFMVAFALCFMCKAEESAFSTPPGTGIIYTNLIDTNFSSSTVGLTFTNVITTARSDYHTFQMFSTPWTNTLATGTNTSLVAIDHSIDGVNWVLAYTNTIGSSGSNNAEYVVEGAWWYHRWRVTAFGTNLSLGLNYMGKRE